MTVGRAQLEAVADRRFDAFRHFADECVDQRQWEVGEVVAIIQDRLHGSRLPSSATTEVRWRRRRGPGR
jgi:hypothetical protein